MDYNHRISAAGNHEAPRVADVAGRSLIAVGRVAADRAVTERNHEAGGSVIVGGVAEDQAVLSRHAAHRLEHLDQPRPRYDAVVEVVVGGDAGDGAERRLATLPPDRPFGRIDGQTDLAGSVPLTSLKQLEIPEGALGDFFGPGTTVGIPFAAQLGVRLTF